MISGDGVRAAESHGYTHRDFLCGLGRKGKLIVRLASDPRGGGGMGERGCTAEGHGHEGIFFVALQASKGIST